MHPFPCRRQAAWDGDREREHMCISVCLRVCEMQSKGVKHRREEESSERKKKPATSSEVHFHKPRQAKQTSAVLREGLYWEDVFDANTQYDYDKKQSIKISNN